MGNVCDPVQADTPVDVYGSRAKPPKTLTKLEREAPYDEVRTRLRETEHALQASEARCVELRASTEAMQQKLHRFAWECDEKLGSARRRDLGHEENIVALEERLNAVNAEAEARLRQKDIASRARDFTADAAHEIAKELDRTKQRLFAVEHDREKLAYDLELSRAEAAKFKQLEDDARTLTSLEEKRRVDDVGRVREHMDWESKGLHGRLNKALEEVEQLRFELRAERAARQRAATLAGDAAARAQEYERAFASTEAQRLRKADALNLQLRFPAEVDNQVDNNRPTQV